MQQALQNNKEYLQQRYLDFVNDPTRKMYLNRIIHLINTAPARCIVMNLNSEIIQHEIAEPHKAMIDRLQETLKEYEIENYSDVMLIEIDRDLKNEQPSLPGKRL